MKPRGVKAFAVGADDGKIHANDGQYFGRVYCLSPSEGNSRCMAENYDTPGDILEKRCGPHRVAELIEAGAKPHRHAHRQRKGGGQ